MTGPNRAVVLVSVCWSLLTTAVLRVDGSQAGGAVASAPAHAALDPSMFAASTECVACHNELMSPQGEDVSIGASWRGSIMANSARDPYFHAGVRRETMDHPSAAAAIEDECATCHLPAGQKIARAAGQHGQVFAHLAVADDPSELSAVALDGVTCTVCHQIASDRLGTRESFNGNFVVAPPLASGRRRAFGPFDPDAGRRRIMHSVSGFEQAPATHIRESELCATCHTLITEALGPDGRVIGSLAEQMNYQEWRHSAFYQERRSCQSCHMPAVEGPVRVASVLGDFRETLSRHTFLGGNVFMLRLLNRFRSELGVQATSAELDATARATLRQLQRDTAVVTLEGTTRSGGLVAFDAVVTNLTGHKFPTGYPSRRAWLHVIVRNEQGGIVFESGRVRPSGLIDGNDADAQPTAFEPHHAEISRADQVQIYESIMGTPAGAPTTGLLQATQYLKDNRLLPRGFDKRTASADIAVVGGAAEDADFGTGGDRVRYRIPVAAAGPVTIDVALHFQPISFRWARNLDAYDAPEPRRFISYYDRLSSTSSTLVAQATARVAP
jgi:hypothetical protein